MGDEKAPQQEALDPNDPRLASDGCEVKKGLDQEDPDHGPFDEADQLVFLETRGGGTRDAYLATAASYVRLLLADRGSLGLPAGVARTRVSHGRCLGRSHSFQARREWDAVSRPRRPARDGPASV